jgi:hypothetical protein
LDGKGRVKNKNKKRKNKKLEKCPKKPGLDVSKPHLANYRENYEMIQV